MQVMPQGIAKEARLQGRVQAPAAGALRFAPTARQVMGIAAGSAWILQQMPAVVDQLQTRQQRRQGWVQRPGRQIGWRQRQEGGDKYPLLPQQRWCAIGTCFCTARHTTDPLVPLRMC